ncbi:MAG: ATP-binding protein [Oscillospiraceae bacterium]
MQKKLFKSMTTLVTAAQLIFAFIAVFVCYNIYRDSVFSDLKTTAAAAVMSEKSPEIISEQLGGLSDYDLRITFIDESGEVLFDNENDIQKMENHKDREEVKQAFESGSGMSERLSKTLDTTYCYYAVRYNGGVLRLGRSRSSMISIVGSVLAALAAILAVLIFITAIISMKLSEYVMRPVLELVKRFDVTDYPNTPPKSEHIAGDEIYEELEPVAQTADSLLEETHRVFRRLTKEKEKFTLITENMAEGMILLDSDNTILSVNRTALQLFNSDYDPSSKQKLSALTTEKQLLDILGQLSESNSARGVIKLGDHFWRTFVNKSEYAGSYGIVIILADVTESVKSEEIRRDFSANVSHELKTPLTTIKGFGEMMENGIISDGDDVKRYGGTIYREAERLLSLINDIIRLSEIEDENSAAQMEQVDLMQTALDCEEILQNKAINHEVTIEIKGDTDRSGGAVVTGSRSYLTELLLNLMDNSIKYNKPGGFVRTTVSAEENGVRIVVEDSGIGISESDCERVFERFYRVDKSRSKETGGTGLGLSIVKHIVGLHGGELSIKSKLGEGTAITIFLPYSH